MVLKLNKSQNVDKMFRLLTVFKCKCLHFARVLFINGSLFFNNYGPKKPKLEVVTLPQGVISNTRIFYNLILRKELTSLEDIQNYLAYTVKIMELSTRFQWTSVLK